jgi:hypothetical protein
MLMKTDELGIPRFTNRDLIDMIYSGHVDKCHVVLCDPGQMILKSLTQQCVNNIYPSLQNIFP